MQLGMATITRLSFMAWQWRVEVQDKYGNKQVTVGGHRRTFRGCLRAVGGKGRSATKLLAK